MTDERIQEAEVRVLLLPLNEDSLLLPNATVVEVVSLDPEVGKDNAKHFPDWFLGSIKWRNRNIAVVSFEKMTNAKLENKTARSRIAICHSFDSDKEAFMGIQVQGIPRLMLLTESSINDVLVVEEKKDWPIVSGVMLGDKKAWIPDIDQLKIRLAEVSP